MFFFIISSANSAITVSPYRILGLQLTQIQPKSTVCVGGCNFSNLPQSLDTQRLLLTNCEDFKAV